MDEAWNQELNHSFEAYLEVREATPLELGPRIGEELGCLGKTDLSKLDAWRTWREDLHFTSVGISIDDDASSESSGEDDRVAAAAASDGASHPGRAVLTREMLAAHDSSLGGSSGSSTDDTPAALYMSGASSSSPSRPLNHPPSDVLPASTRRSPVSPQPTQMSGYMGRSTSLNGASIKSSSIVDGIAWDNKTSYTRGFENIIEGAEVGVVGVCHGLTNGV